MVRLQTLDLRIGVRIPASQPLIPWQLAEIPENLKWGRVAAPREITIGPSAAKHLLLVCFTEPTTDHIRIISARRATKAEQHDYEEYIAN